MQEQAFDSLSSSRETVKITPRQAARILSQRAKEKVSKATRIENGRKGGLEKAARSRKK